jgi:putative transposase
VFQKPEDYDAFVAIMAEAALRIPMRVLAYCLLPNHFHLALWPREDGDLSRWMHWLMTTHVRRHLGRYHVRGHIWQGRFKAFPIQGDEHLLTVLRYIERNPLRAGLVERAQDWPWSSLRWFKSRERTPVKLEEGTIARGDQWGEEVNAASADIDLETIRLSMRRDRPFGSPEWMREAALALGLEYSMRPQGRPRRSTAAASIPSSDEPAKSSAT